MSIDRDEMLEAMRFVAYKEARNRLSREGEEVLDMLSSVDDTGGMDLADAFGDARAYDVLSEADKLAVETYVTRTTLIDGFKDYVG